MAADDGVLPCGGGERIPPGPRTLTGLRILIVTFKPGLEPNAGTSSFYLLPAAQRCHIRYASGGRSAPPCMFTQGLHHHKGNVSEEVALYQGAWTFAL